MIEDTQITWYRGELKLRPLKWVVRRLPKGQGQIIGDFCTLSGEYKDLIANAQFLGGVVSFEDEGDMNPDPVTDSDRWVWGAAIVAGVLIVILAMVLIR